MERSASNLGHHFHIADAIVGGLILAAVTSLPNAVAAVHLASKGRGAAALSTALSSNNLNVVFGLLIPGAMIGLAAPSFVGNLHRNELLVAHRARACLGVHATRAQPTFGIAHHWRILRICPVAAGSEVGRYQP
jgi:Ca2+/Na+ antiporter